MFAFLIGLMLGGGIGYALTGCFEKKNALVFDYKAYEIGYDDGYKEGHKEGYLACEKDIDEGVIDE